MVAKLTPTTKIFLLALAAGLGLGIVLSFLFGRLALPVKPFQFTLFGIGTGELIANVILIAIIGAIVFLSYVSAITQDTTFPTAHPWSFLVETLFVALVPASVVYVITDFRDNGKLDFSKLNKDFLLMAAKFGIFHLLFQFSGVYSYFFR